MSDDKKDSGFRGRIDRFFDKQAKEQQNLLQGKVGETSIKDSWDEVKSKVGGKKSSRPVRVSTFLKISVEESGLLDKAVCRTRGLKK